MNLRNLEDVSLLKNLKHFAKEERKLIALILTYLQEVENRKLHLHLAFASMFSFCTEYLGYTGREAMLRIQAMRLAKSIPEVKTKIQTGELSLTVVANVQSHIARENKANKEKDGKPISLEATRKIVEAVSKQSVKQSERTLLELFPSQQGIIFEKVRPIPNGMFRVEMNLSAETFQMLQTIQSLRSHVVPMREFEPIMRDLCELGIKKWQPVKRRGPPLEELKH